MAKTFWKPTVDQIKSLLESCQKIYQPVFDLYSDDEKFYELEFKDLLTIPSEFKSNGVVLPTARDMVDACVDNTDVFNARVFVNKKSTSNTSEEQMEMMRKFYLGLIHRTSVESSISPWRIGAKHYWLHGQVCFKTVWDADRWVDRPTQKTGESDTEYNSRIDDWRVENGSRLPIVIQAVHPMNIMPDPYENGGRFIFEQRDELVYDVLNKHPSWSNPKGVAVEKTVKHVSFWTPKYRCELYDGEPMLPVTGGVAEHDYGFVPYVVIDTGLGNLDSKNDPAKKYVGILRYMKDILVSESRDYSIADIVLSKTAWPWGTIEGDHAEEVKTIDQTFGTFSPMPKGTKLVPQTPQVPPTALAQHLSITASYIASHAAPNSLRGLGESGVRSGVDRQQLITQAQAKYTYSSEAFRNGTAKVLAHCAYIMKNIIPDDINVWARTPTDEFDVEVKRDKMIPPFTCYVEFAPIDENDEYKRHDDLERLVSSHIVTSKWARTQMSNVNPKELELQEEVDRLKNDPQVNQIVSQYMAMKLQAAIQKKDEADNAGTPAPGQGILPLAQAGGTLVKTPVPGMAGAVTRTDLPGVPTQSMPPQGQPPMPMGVRSNTPMPNIAPLGSAASVQQQMAKQRSQTPMNPNQGKGGGGNR